MGARGRAGQRSARHVDLIDGLGPDVGGLFEHRQGAPGIGRIDQRLVDQGFELSIAIEGPPAIQRRRLQAVGSGAGGFIGDRRRRLRLRNLAGRGAAREHGCGHGQDQKGANHSDTERELRKRSGRCAFPTLPSGYDTVAFKGDAGLWPRELTESSLLFDTVNYTSGGATTIRAATPHAHRMNCARASRWRRRYSGKSSSMSRTT